MRERKEDIEPNLEFELKRYLEREGENITFNKEARERYPCLCKPARKASGAPISAIYRLPSRALATLAPHGALQRTFVDDEVRRLNDFWRLSSGGREADTQIEELLGSEAAASLDRFDATQLSAVISACRDHATASAAGRALFANSRLEKKSNNDADRLVKYLARFNLKFDEIRSTRRME